EQTLQDDGSDPDDDETEPNWWFGIRRKMREPLAEWLGTMVMVLMGVCGNLQVKTSQNQAGSFSQSAAMWGLGTMMAIYVAGGVLGNPMVSINLSVFRDFPARKAVIYICSQILGAICAVWIAYGIYKDAILSIDPQTTADQSPTSTGTAFFTLPAPFASIPTAFMTDFTLAAVMSGVVLAIGDDTNQ
ncbi:aquaporin-like protein, partial [Polyplosphaeria fusca]